MYIDPAFGGMLLQVALGIVAVGGAIIYSVKRRAKKLLGKDNTNEHLNPINANTSGKNEMVDTLAESETTEIIDGSKSQVITQTEEK